MKTIEIELRRIENCNAWLWGELIIEGVKYCDSLEFGSGIEIKQGLYKLKSCFGKITRIQYIMIFDLEDTFFSSFVRHNNIMFYDIELRLENNYISLGKKKGSAHLINSESIYYKFLKYIENLIENGFQVNLRVNDMYF